MSPLTTYNLLAANSISAQVLNSAATGKTLDILFWALMVVGFFLIFGIVAGFVWEYRKMRKYFEEHTLL
ncbi:hypothetical protein A3I45_01615 [Candidatus Uhrbacteria bacterium RIFCSPLOWO2_02_FULL_53_10]|uniref:Uncharacterized protein n=1 Tax=Candidatus Uhrbacteria bacterium RIFCSPLOWO2_02_FULL_53_10 TaxID=1802411 RepID=A0A1F7VJT2_9BACT|nr:MAG: hypothetical protein A3I45_01615 [Candidatus Uhrbacteria bacterium RIFCSPLOWO2_02_FULL_53_10]